MNENLKVSFYLKRERKKKKNGNSVYRHLKNYLKDKLNVNDIPFGKINISLIENYAYYLKVDLQLAANSVRSFIIPFQNLLPLPKCLEQ